MVVSERDRRAHLSLYVCPECDAIYALIVSPTGDWGWFCFDGERWETVWVSQAAEEVMAA